jgi:hypothetical protein
MAETATKIALPGGTECLFAGKGATLAYEGQRLNYTCGDSLGLIGDIAIANGTEMTVTTATIAGTEITGSEPLTFTIEAIELADGTTCLNAGHGATLAFEGKRLNYTCTENTALVGDITQSGETFMVENATLDGTNFVSSERVNIQTLSAVAP